MCKAGNELQGPALKMSKDEGPDGEGVKESERGGKARTGTNRSRKGEEEESATASRTNRGVFSCWDWVEPKGWMELDLLQERMKRTREQEEEAGNRERGVVVVS